VLRCLLPCMGRRLRAHWRRCAMMHMPEMLNKAECSRLRQEAEAEAKILAWRPVWPGGFHVTAYCRMVAAKKGRFSSDWLLPLQDAAKPCLISREMASLESSHTVSASATPIQSGLCPPCRGSPNNQSLQTDMRVYLQALVYYDLGSVYIDVTVWGWRKQGHQLVPIAVIQQQVLQS